jgi:hypothetical protein
VTGCAPARAGPVSPRAGPGQTSAELLFPWGKARLATRRHGIVHAGWRTEVMWRARWDLALRNGQSIPTWDLAALAYSISICVSVQFASVLGIFKCFWVLCFFALYAMTRSVLFRKVIDRVQAVATKNQVS